MDEAYAAYLERVRAHRGEMGEAMRALDEALALPAGLGSLWRRRVRAALTELAHDLRTHVDLTEAPGGLYADLRTTAPRLSLRVDSQLADHGHYLAEVDRLLAERDDGVEDVEAHRESLNLLLAHLARHRQRGSDLVYEAYVIDIGGSG